MQKYYQNQPTFNVVFSRNKLPKIKDGTYVIKLDEQKSMLTHLIALYVNRDNVTYILLQLWNQTYSRRKYKMQ